MTPTLSVVVPAHNEAAHIRACLECLLGQVDDLHEIIVVDNNCTDDTVDIVRDVAAGDHRVRVITESRPGVTHARNAGFAAARGSLVARVDADTRVTPCWARAILTFFERTGTRYAGGSGLCHLHDLPFQRPFRVMQRSADTRLAARVVADRSVSAPELIGLNMVLRRDVWCAVEPHLSTRTDVHEDTDLSLCVGEYGAGLALVPGMTAETSGRRYLTGFRSFLSYCAAGARTYWMHGRRFAATGALATSTAALAFYAVMWVPFRAWNPATERFDVRRVLFCPDRDTGRVTFADHRRSLDCVHALSDPVPGDSRLQRGGDHRRAARVHT